MKKAYFILTLCLILLIASLHTTQSYFSQSVVSGTNTFLTASEFPITQTNATPTLSTPTPTERQLADHIVISEIQIDTGNGNIANDSDFIELFNPTASPINLNGYRLVKRTGGAGNDNNIFTFQQTHIIPAFGFFLWAHQSRGSNPNNYAEIISADVSSAEVLGASNSIALRLGELNTGIIIDALSWDPGASSLKEGSQYPANPQENQSLERKAYSSSTVISMISGGSDQYKGNSLDTENNATDYVLRPISEPQNSNSSIEVPL